MIPANTDLDKSEELAEEFREDEDEPRYRTDEDELQKWPGLIIFGAVSILAGLVFISKETNLSIIFFVMGICLFVFGAIVRKIEGAAYVPSEIDAEWKEKTENEEIKQDFESRLLHRQRDKDEIVKEVKSTIKVRCRYCGTLNDEGANKCESCGGVL